MLQTNVIYIHVQRCFSRDIFWRYFWRDMLRTNVMYIHVWRCFSRDNSRDIFGDMLQTNVMYIHVQGLSSGDTLCTYFQRHSPDQCDVYPCLEMFFQRYTLQIFLEICSRSM